MKKKQDKKRLPCSVCPFVLTRGEAKVGDICPWCKKGKLTKPTKLKTRAVRGEKDERDKSKINY